MKWVIPHEAFKCTITRRFHFFVVEFEHGGEGIFMLTGEANCEQPQTQTF